MKKIIFSLVLGFNLVLANDFTVAFEAHEKGDYQEGFKYFKLACDGGIAEGCASLGILYAEGLGVKQSYKTAKEYFGKACDLGLQQGCDEYATLNKAGY